MELLNIREVVDRDTVSIFGKAYEVLGPEDLGPLEYAAVNRGHETAQRLSNVKRPTPAQKREIDRALASVVQTLIPSLPAAVLKRLDQNQRANIVFVWVARAIHISKEAEATANPPKPSRRTGSASSRGSKRSTAATRKSGSTRRRTS